MSNEPKHPEQAEGAQGERTRGLSEEAESTIIGMVEYCLNARVCLGMDEGFKSFDPEEEHGFVKELREFVAGRAALAQPSSVPEAWIDVQAERRRQVEVEGWTHAHDDANYGDCSLAAAAATYALCDHPSQLKVCGADAWPWPDHWWKPTTYRRNLVKAGALILAEIERIDRAAAPAQGGRDD